MDDGEGMEPVEVEEEFDPMWEQLQPQAFAIPPVLQGADDLGGMNAMEVEEVGENIENHMIDVDEQDPIAEAAGPIPDIDWEEHLDANYDDDFVDEEWQPIYLGPAAGA
jgi:hypothetical protein